MTLTTSTINRDGWDRYRLVHRSVNRMKQDLIPVMLLMTLSTFFYDVRVLDRASFGGLNVQSGHGTVCHLIQWLSIMLQSGSDTMIR